MEKHRLVRPQTVKLLWCAFLVILALTVAADFAVTHVPHFGVDGSFAFHAWFGFLACAILIVAVKGLGAILGRPENYYGTRDD